MLEIGVIVFSAVKVKNRVTYLLWDGGSRLPSFVAVDKEALAFPAVTSDQAVNMASCTAQSESSPVLISMGVLHQSFYNLILL